MYSIIPLSLWSYIYSVRLDLWFKQQSGILLTHCHADITVLVDFFIVSFPPRDSNTFHMFYLRHFFICWRRNAVCRLVGVYIKPKLRLLRDCIPYQLLSGAARQTAGGPWGKFSGIFPCDGPPGTEKIEHGRTKTYSILSSAVFSDVCLILARLILISIRDYWRFCYTANIFCVFLGFFWKLMHLASLFPNTSLSFGNETNVPFHRKWR